MHSPGFGTHRQHVPSGRGGPSRARPHDSPERRTHVPRLDVIVTRMESGAERMLARCLRGFRSAWGRQQPRGELPTPATHPMSPGRSQHAGSLSTLAEQCSPAPQHELALGYGRSKVVLLAVDPFHVHAYWELTDADARLVRRRLPRWWSSAAPAWVLRFYDVTCVDFDGTNAHGYFDIPVQLGARNWFVELWSAEKTYFVELGLRSGHHFSVACRSNFVNVPRADRPAPVRIDAGPATDGPAVHSHRQAPQGARSELTTPAVALPVFAVPAPGESSAAEHAYAFGERVSVWRRAVAVATQAASRALHIVGEASRSGAPLGAAPGGPVSEGTRLRARSAGGVAARVAPRAAGSSVPRQAQASSGRASQSASLGSLPSSSPGGGWSGSKVSGEATGE